MFPEYAGNISTEVHTMNSSSPGPEASNISPDLSLIYALIVYPIIVILSVLTNCVIIFVIGRTQSLHTMSNFYIVILSICNLLMGTLCSISTVYIVFTDSWILPEFLCKLNAMLNCVICYISTYTLAMIAIDRYISVFYQCKKSLKMGIFNMMIILVIAISASSPLFIYQIVKDNKCIETMSPDGRITFSVITLVFEFFLPCLITSLCYYRINKALIAKCSSKINSGLVSRHQEEIELKRKQCTEITLFLMVLDFALCWAPFNIFWILVDMKVMFFSRTKFLILYSIAMSSAFSNSILYTWLNSSFNRELGKWRIFKYIKRQTYTQQTSDHIKQNNSSLRDNQL